MTDIQFFLWVACVANFSVSIYLATRIDRLRKVASLMNDMHEAESKFFTEIIATTRNELETLLVRQES